MAIVPITPLKEAQDVYFLFKGTTSRNRVCDVVGVLLMPELPGKGENGFDDFRKQYFDLLNTRDSIRTPVMLENPEEFAKAY